MRSLRLVGFGMLVVVLDVRYAGVDLLADLAGWVLMFVGLWRARLLDKAFGTAAWAALVGAVVSVPDLLRFAVGGSSRAAVLVVAAGVLAIFACTGVMRLAEQAGNNALVGQVGWLRSAQVVSVVVSLVVVWDPVSLSGGGWGLPGFLLAGVTFVAGMLFVVLMFSQSVRETGTQRSQAIT